MNIREGNREARKAYVAPDLYFESFVLSQSIAAGCGDLGIATVKSTMKLGYFTETTPSNYAGYECEEDVSGVWEGYCYTAGGSNQLFLS